MGCKNCINSGLHCNKENENVFNNFFEYFINLTEFPRQNTLENNMISYSLPELKVNFYF